MSPNDRDEIALETTMQPAAEPGDTAGTKAMFAAVMRSPEILRARASARSQLFGGAQELVRVDRFMLLRRLGSGGMGVVYAAYDPELDRKVAVKLLRRDGSGGHTEQMHTRLLREAQAMAKVSHPNVVTVHQVGTFDGQVYIAMEFIDGVTLTRWLRAQQRSWADIRRAFLAVGQGLAAAHAAGLVHRDFKLDNVMISENARAAGQPTAPERIVVLDFGLALQGARSHDADHDAIRADVERTHADLESNMTETGALLGTPAYMAPEQHRSARVDARADQFSYCVALFEAVYGRRPFPARTMTELVNAVATGRIDAPSDRGELPRRAYRALLRGLDRDPARRFASMADLLAEIAHDPAIARRRWITAATIGAAALVGAAAFDRLGEEPACDAAAGKLAAAWSSDIRAGGRAAFLASNKRYATETWTAVEHAIDGQVQRWRDVHSTVCSADQAPEADRLGRLLCLEWRAQEIHAIAELFAQADGEIVERALDAVAEIAAPEACASDRAIHASARLPDDPQLRRAVLDARTELARVKGLGDAGKIRDAIDHVTRLRETAVAREHLPLSAEIDERLGRLRRQAGDVVGAEAELTSAVYTALAAEQDDLALRSIVQLVGVIGSDRVDLEQAVPWVRLGEALEQRVGNVAGSDLRVAVGSMLALSGRHDEARAAFREALTRQESITGPHSSELVPALLVLANAVASGGEPDEGIAIMERALQVATATSGAETPEAAAVRVAYGEMAWKLGRYDVAREQFTESLRVEELVRGPDHPATAQALVGLARIAWSTGADEDALSRLDRVERVAEEGRIDDAVRVAALEVRGQILARLGRAPEANKAIDRALAVARRLGVEHPLQAFPLVARAEVKLAAGQAVEALRTLEGARKILAASLDPRDPRRQEISVGLGRALLISGDHTRGLEVLQRATDALRSCCPGHASIREAEAAIAGARGGSKPSPITERGSETADLETVGGGAP